MEDWRTLHALVDELPEPELLAARRYLEYLRETVDPLRQALDAAPADDELMTDDDLSAMREGHADLARAETASHDDIKRLLSDTG